MVHTMSISESTFSVGFNLIMQVMTIASHLISNLSPGDSGRSSVNGSLLRRMVGLAQSLAHDMAELRRGDK